MTADKYEQAKETRTEPSLRDVHEAVTSLTGLVRNMSSRIEDIAKTTEDIHDMVSYHHNSPGYDGGSDYDAFDDSEE